jgi:hypothetical protein
MNPKDKDPKGKAARKLSKSVRKLSDEEIKIFLEVLGALMASVPAPRDARKKYLKDVENRLRNNGVAFLSKSRSFPTYGLKMLGRDQTGFPIDGFKIAEGKVYPRLFAWYWAELERLSKLDKPKKSDALRAQRVLCVLSFSKMLKISTVNQIKKALTDFENRVSTPTSANASAKTDKNPGTKNAKDDPEKDFKSLFSGLSLLETLGIKSTALDLLPQYTDFNSISTKPCALASRPELPEWFAGQFMKISRNDDGSTVVKVPTIGIKPPPYGKVKVLTEAAGKLRIIVPYNSPFVHSTGLYARARCVLNTLQGDCSVDQTRGHRLIEQFTRENGNNLDLAENIVSADLESFSDNTSTESYSFGLDGLNLKGLDDYLFNLPVTLPSGKVIVPSKLLMGCKGTFELSSVLHHLAVKVAEIYRYALCGDDLVFRGDLLPYTEAIKPFGWSLNHSKTVVSKTAAVFCGEMYWFGMRVSPRIPKVHSIFVNSRLRKASVIFSVVRDAIASLNTIYSRRVTSRISGPLIRQLRLSWRGIIIPTLPVKLRGLGMKSGRPGKGLCSLLKSKASQRVALMSIGIERELLDQNRWFGLPIQINPADIQLSMPDFPALLSRGAVQLRVPRVARALPKHVSSLDLYQAFEWYYDDVRLPASEFAETTD